MLNLPFPAAVKTGTTNDFRDNWTMGYTPDLAVGVWVGNADYTPMQNTTGLTGAAPIWAEFMQHAIQQLTGGNPTPFSRPARHRGEGDLRGLRHAAIRVVPAASARRSSPPTSRRCPRSRTCGRRWKSIPGPGCALREACD